MVTMKWIEKYLRVNDAALSENKLLYQVQELLFIGANACSAKTITFRPVQKNMN